MTTAGAYVVRYDPKAIKELAKLDKPNALRRRRTAMNISTAGGKVFAQVFRGLKLVRLRRPIHPEGVLLSGSILRDASAEPCGIPWLDEFTEAPVQARFSRSVGLPGRTPDILGLALRIQEGSGFFDVLLASTGRSFPGRFLLLPHREVSSATLSSLMPYKGRSGPVLLAATTLEPTGPLPVRAEPFRNALGRRAWVLAMHHGSPRGAWRRFAALTLTLDARHDDDGLRFDPIRNPLPGAETYAWTRALRAPSYEGARE